MFQSPLPKASDMSVENMVSFLDTPDSRNKGLHNVVNENKFEY